MMASRRTRTAITDKNCRGKNPVEVPIDLCIWAAEPKYCSLPLFPFHGDTDEAREDGLALLPASKLGSFEAMIAKREESGKEEELHPVSRVPTRRPRRGAARRRAHITVSYFISEVKR